MINKSKLAATCSAYINPDYSTRREIRRLLSDVMYAIDYQTIGFIAGSFRLLLLLVMLPLLYFLRNMVSDKVTDQVSFFEKNTLFF